MICDLCHTPEAPMLHHLAKWESFIVEVQEHAGWGYGPDRVVTRTRTENRLEQRKCCRTCYDGVRAMQVVS